MTALRLSSVFILKMNEQEILVVIYDAYLKHSGDPGIHFVASTRMDEPDRCSLAAHRKSLGDWHRRYYRIRL